MRRKYCSPEVYCGELRDRAADIFSLGCVFIEMITVLCGIHLNKFADHRSQNSDGDESFHSNLTRVEEWIEQLRLVLQKDFLWRLNMSVKIDTAAHMLSYLPDQRPLALEVLNCLGGPRSCCISERETYEVEPSQKGYSQ
jgi:serine/threonine protein kinase